MYVYIILKLGYDILRLFLQQP